MILYLQSSQEPTDAINKRKDKSEIDMASWFYYSLKADSLVFYLGAKRKKMKHCRDEQEEE